MKDVYIPEDLRTMNLEADTSQWCWKRSAETRDLIFMWQRGFGHDLQDAPRLEGKPMNVNLSVLMERVQSFYTFSVIPSVGVPILYPPARPTAIR